MVSKTDWIVVGVMVLLIILSCVAVEVERKKMNK